MRARLGTTNARLGASRAWWLMGTICLLSLYPFPGHAAERTLEARFWIAPPGASWELAANGEGVSAGTSWLALAMSVRFERMWAVELGMAPWRQSFHVGPADLDTYGSIGISPTLADWKQGGRGWEMEAGGLLAYRLLVRNVRKTPFDNGYEFKETQASTCLGVVGFVQWNYQTASRKRVLMRFLLGAYFPVLSWESWDTSFDAEFESVAYDFGARSAFEIGVEF